MVGVEVGVGVVVVVVVEVGVEVGVEVVVGVVVVVGVGVGVEVVVEVVVGVEVEVVMKRVWICEKCETVYESTNDPDCHYGDCDGKVYPFLSQSDLEKMLKERIESLNEDMKMREASINPIERLLAAALVAQIGEAESLLQTIQGEE